MLKKSALPLKLDLKPDSKPALPVGRPAEAAPSAVTSVNARYLQTLLGYNARRVSLKAMDLFGERMAAYGLSPVDFSVLSLIGHNPGITSRQLCSALSLLPPNLVAKISQMEKRDLLIKMPHPEDGRAIGLHLTARASDMMQRAEQTATGLEADVGRNLSAAESKTLLLLLQKIYLN